MILLALLACADPALVPFRDAAKAYDAGRASLNDGDTDAALASFAAARALDPHSASLPLWHGKALAAAGRLDEAIAAAGDALVRDPKSGPAYYNRAAWLARSGKLQDSAADLRLALGLGAATRWDAARDPDFAPHRRDPAFVAILPQDDLLARVAGPAESSFVGSELALTFTFSGPSSVVPTLAGPAVPACLRQTRIVQDEDEPEPGTTIREVRVYFRAVTPCVANVGPFEARDTAGAPEAHKTVSVAMPAVTVTVLGPEGMALAEGVRPAAWLVPAGVVDGGSVAGWPGAKIRMGTRPAGSLVSLEWRVRQQTRVVGGVVE